MEGIDRWDWLMLAGAALVAVVSLAQLMLARRDEIVRRLEADAAAEDEARRRAAADQRRKEAAARSKRAA